MRGLKIIGLMVAFMIIFGTRNIKADNRTNINYTLYGNLATSLGAYINTREYPGLYTDTNSGNDINFAIGDADGNFTRFYPATPGNTFTITQPSTVKGPNSIITLFLQNESAINFVNTFNGILFH